MIRTLLAGVIASTMIASCQSQPVYRQTEGPLETVPSVEIDRYLGLWYEIARLPNSFEKDCEGVTAEYSKRDDGLIRVVNSCRKGAPDGPLRTAKGRARIADPDTNSKLEVSFFGPFWGDYWIIDLAEDYSLAVVTEPGGRYLWVLARAPQLSDAETARVRAVIENAGYDYSDLYFPAQPPL